MRKVYSSDITREQFELISADLENLKKTTKPRKIDLYEVFCGHIVSFEKCLYMGRDIPSDFPKMGIVRYYYDVWTVKGTDGLSILDYVIAKLTDIHRYEEGRKPLPSMLIIDSKTVQNADTASQKGYDGGKKNLV
ncbi:MAG: hypothetical protein FWF57_08250 [Defluviitaleaceae bacterium]|nr:hypothetical protein [Defluviitaleaceae bacterium]